jgi:hypothetical protein
MVRITRRIEKNKIQTYTRPVMRGICGSFRQLTSETGYIGAAILRWLPLPLDTLHHLGQTPSPNGQNLRWEIRL